MAIYSIDIIPFLQKKVNRTSNFYAKKLGYYEQCSFKSVDT